MFKQHVTALMVLCVSILMLTLAVVPHHHHDGFPCFAVENCLGHSGNCDSHSDCCRHHQHEPVSDSEEACALDRLEFIAFDQKVTPVCPVCLHLHNHHLLQAVLITYNYDFSLPAQPDISPQKPYLNHYYSLFASRSLGLRAPPVA